MECYMCSNEIGTLLDDTKLDADIYKKYGCVKENDYEVV